MVPVWTLASLLAACHLCHGYVDFSHLTSLTAVPTASIPRPHQLPSSWQVYDTIPQHPMITAVAPFLTVNDNGTHTLSWSTTYHVYSRRFQNARGVLKRQNGVFQSDASLLATCTPCHSGNSGSNQTASNICSTVPYSGILAGNIPVSAGGLCYGSNYTGPLLPAVTSTGLPCCPTCTPVTNSTLFITSGVLVPTTTANGTTVITQVSNTTITITLSTVGPEASTTTVIAQTSTLPPVTWSVSTVMPNTTSNIPSPIVTVAAAIVVGCGTASGSGTVVGSGTVFLGPGGIFPVTSSGTVSGFASKVIGCGTLIATTGSFHGTATITGCGTASGCAVLTGIGTVYPDALGGFIGITSSGVASGCGKVVGCGTLIGSGTFSLTAPVTTTIMPTPPRSTVNVYISYCPPDPTAPFRIAGNMTGLSNHGNSHSSLNNDSSLADVASSIHHLPFPPLNSTSSFVRNMTNTNTTFINPLCQVCPNDSGICCPLYVACGADGHCPYAALQRSGYTRFGVNVVECDNSSAEIGMIRVEGRKAPGLPVPLSSPLEKKNGNNVVRRGAGGRHGHGHGHEHGGPRLRWG